MWLFAGLRPGVRGGARFIFELGKAEARIVVILEREMPKISPTER
jgi:hypothetical protein